MFAIELYAPLQEKINQPITQLQNMVVNTAGQGRLVLTDGTLKKYVSTCNQYKEALSESYHIESTYDASMMSYFTLWCGSLDWLEKAKPASESFVKQFALEQSFGQLPASLFYSALGSSGKPKTLIDKYPDATLGQIGQHSVTIESKKAHIQAVISLLAKADFNHNKQQDLLVSIAEYNVNGSHRQYGVFAIGKASAQSDFVRIDF